MKGKFYIAIGVAFALLMAIIVGCNLGEIVGDPAEAEGSISVRLKGPLVNIVPSIPMEPTLYHIVGSGPSSSFDVTEGGDTVIRGLEDGEWTVDVYALNSEGTDIGAGTNTVQVEKGPSTPCPVLVEEYTGLGTLSLTTTWSPSVFEANIESELIPGGGAAVDISEDWIPGTDSASYTDDLERGWYGVIFRLISAENLVGGWATCARVVAANTTTAEISFGTSEKGSLDILITPDFLDPLNLTADVGEGAVDVYPTDIVTITASGGDVYLWYLNGLQVGSAPAFSIVADAYDVGTFNLSLLSFSSDGKHAGSLHWTVVKADVMPAQSTVGGVFSYGGGPGLPYVVEIMAADLTTVVASIPGTTMPSPFLFEGLPDGTYYLRATVTGGDTYRCYYLGDGYNPPAAPNIVIPNPLPEAYDVDLGEVVAMP